MWQWALCLLHGLCKKHEAHLLAFHNAGTLWEIKTCHVFLVNQDIIEIGEHPWLPLTKESLISVMPQSRGCTNYIRFLRVSRSRCNIHPLFYEGYPNTLRNFYWVCSREVVSSLVDKLNENYVVRPTLDGGGGSRVQISRNQFGLIWSKLNPWVEPYLGL
jgi:hypothetical protein